MNKSVFVALLMTAAMLLTSCSFGTGGNDGALTIMGKKSDLEKSYMTSIFEHYEDSTGKKLKIIAYEDSEFESKASADMKNGNGPDILMHFNNADLAKFNVDENFYYLNDESWVSDLTDGAKDYCTDKNGNLLGLPYWENSVSGCYYNKTVLDSLGLKPASTQAEFDVLCEVLKELGYTPICWPGDGCSWMLQFALDPLFADNPELLEKINSNKITFADIPEITDMVTWINNAALKGWFGNDYLSCGWSDISPTIGSGKAVMTFIWDTWFYTDFDSGNKYSIDDFALMPVFLNTTANGTYEGGNLNMMMINKNSENVDNALEFLEFCATPENYNIAFEGISTVSCFKGENTNIQSKMVTDASASIAEYGRVSTAASRIIGYSAEDMVGALNELFRKKTDIAGCIEQMDDKRIANASSEGAAGF